MSNENQATVDELTKRAVRAEAIAAMSMKVRKHFDALAKDAQEEFLALDASAQASEITKAAEANAVVYKAADGTEYRKSDDPRLVQMAKDRDEDRKEIVKAREAAQEAAVETIAKSFEHLPGDLEVRKALVKSVQSIADATQRDAAMSALKAQNDALASAFKSVGTTGAAAPVSDAETQLESLAKAHMEKSGGTYAKAYDAVLKTSAGRALYNQTVN